MGDIDRTIAALASPVRRDILALVWERELAAGEIAAAFSVTKPTISQHLALLRDAGLVRMTAAGTSRRYRARPEALVGLRAALEGSDKWTIADRIPERRLADTRVVPAVVVTVDVSTDAATTFAAFTDPVVYSRWLGVPVTIDDGHFAATLEWGTEVRGVYEVVSPPDLIAMRWDFEDDTVPVPDGEFVAYLRVHPRSRRGARVEVQQLVHTPAQTEFMEAAWGLVLGRLQNGVTAASDPDGEQRLRPRRSKRRDAN